MSSDAKSLDAKFFNQMPKLELHAHLNGSLDTNAIKELAKEHYGETTPAFNNLVELFTDFTNLDECFGKFKYIHELTATRRGLKLATELAIRSFAADNVIYLELRTTPKCNKHMNKREYLETVIEAIKGFTNSNILVKLLVSIDRSQSVHSAEETFQIVLELRKEYPNIITGIDLSGNPKCGQFKEFRRILEEAHRHDLKLTLHCAEIENPVEIEEMVNFIPMARCGHGTFLTANQISILAERKVAIECCLTSNVKCATVPDYGSHHFFHIKGPVTLCTDDSGVFDTTLSKELEIANETFKLGKTKLLQLQLHAVEHAFTSQDSEKEILRKIVQDYFAKNNDSGS